MAISDVSQKYDVILRKFENFKHQNILAFTVWLIVPITLLILQNRQFGRFAAKNSKLLHLHFVHSDRMSQIDGIEKTTRLPCDCSNNFIHIPEEQFHLGSMLLLVLSAGAAFTIPEHLGY